MKFRNFTGQIPNFVGGFSGFNPTESPGILWELNTYKFRGSLSTSSETAPTGLWFKPDGTKVFVVGSTQDRLKSWDLTTAWDINTATNFINMTVILQDNTGVVITNPTGVSFSDDGTKCFVTDQTNNALYRYSLGTAWDIRTVNPLADQVNTTIYTANLSPQSIWVRPDGLRFATQNTGATAQSSVWSTTIANDITTLTNVNSTNAGFTPVGGVFADNGNRWISVTQSDDLVRPYTVTGAYTLNGLNPDTTRVVTAQDTTPQDIYVKNDGTAFYYLGSASDSIYQFTLN